MRVSSSSPSSGTMDSHDLVPAIDSLSISSSTETSSSCYSIIDKVISDIDLLTLILIRLPAKSLLGLKSVSKQWLSLISDPIFVVTHSRSRRHKHKTSGLFLESPHRFSDDIFQGFVDTDEYFEVIYDFLLLDDSKYEKVYTGEEKDRANTTVTGRWCGFEIPRKFGDEPKFMKEYPLKITQSCNGLLCCNIENYIDDEINGGSILDVTSTPVYKTYIYNPTTRQYKRLPPSPFRDNVPKRVDCWINVCSISLAFDPIKSTDYQVICIWRVEPRRHWDRVKNVNGKFYIEIYSSKTNSWRKLSSTYANPFYGGTCMFSRPGVYWNGCLHWIAYRSAESSIYFDIEQELVKPLPASPSDTVKPLQTSIHSHLMNVMYFGECGGNLYLIEHESRDSTHFDILKMEIDYSAWKRIYRLESDRLVALYPGNSPLFVQRYYFHRLLVLFVEEDEAESLSKLVVAVSGDKVISYDPKEMSVTEIHTFPETYFYLIPPVFEVQLGRVHLYVESLVCV